MVHRRLSEWCVFCSKSIDAVKAPETPQASDPKTDQFIIGDEDDDDESRDNDNPDAETLPPYEPQASTSNAAPLEQESHPKPVEETSTNLHYISPKETLHGIALKYGLQPSHLVALNQLPPAILSSQPSLLHTRSFLLLPPGVQSRAPDPHDPPDVAYYKSVLRRFQTTAKCADPNIADIYVSSAFEKKKQELEFIRENRLARGLDTEQTVPEQGGELEDALEAFKLDSKWESEHQEHAPIGCGSSASKGRWTGLTAGLLKGRA